jgi:hypothetical protein
MIVKRSCWRCVALSFLDKWQDCGFGGWVGCTIGGLAFWDGVEWSLLVTALGYGITFMGLGYIAWH